MGTDNLTTEERLSRISARLDAITEIWAMAGKSLSGIIIDLQREIEDTYLSLEAADNEPDEQNDSTRQKTV